MKKLLSLFFLLSTFHSLLSTPIIQAASTSSFSFETAAAASVGDDVKVDVVLDPHGNTIDTARINISFSKDVLEATDVLPGTLFPRVLPDSTFSNDTGTASLGVFTLKPTSQKGVIGSFIFHVKAAGQASIIQAANSHAIDNGTETASNGLIQATIDLTSAPTGQVALTVTSPTHPDPSLWYAKSAFTAVWSAPGHTIKRSTIAFDHNPTTEPHDFTTTESSWANDVHSQGGLWYFHVQSTLENGTKTAIAHIPVRIDTTLPNDFSLHTDSAQIVEGQPSSIAFATTDDISGIKAYGISLNTGDFIESTSPHVFTDLKPGDYLVRVQAVDQAGNKKFSSTRVRVYPKGTDVSTILNAGVTDTRLPLSNPPPYEGGVRGGLFVLAAVLVALAGLALWKKRR